MRFQIGMSLWLRWMCLGCLLMSAGARGQAEPAGVPDAAAVGSGAAEFSLVTGREPVASLVGLWRFHPGDDARWAEPGWDDSGWPLLRSDEPWSVQGYKGLSGLAWYRFAVELPPGDAAYSVVLPTINYSYQVFVDGTLVRTVGDMAPRRTTWTTRPLAIELPRFRRAGPARYIIALRVRAAFPNAAGPDRSRAQVVALADEASARLARDLRLDRLDDMNDLALCTLNLVAAIFSIALFLLSRRETEYLWFGLATLFTALMDGLEFLRVGRIWDFSLFWSGRQILLLIVQLSLIAFYRKLLRAKPGWGIRLTLACTVLLSAWILLVEFGPARFYTWNGVALALLTPYVFWTVSLLIRRAWQRVPDALLLLVPVLLSSLQYFYRNIAVTLAHAGHPPSFSGYWQLTTVPFAIWSSDVVQSLFLLSMVAILLNRSVRTRREQDRVEEELLQAAEVQHVLIPERLPEVAGFRVEAAYLPAQVVGGDFFQVLPVADGGVLVVVGDVAGKGMAAAMTVSMLVGAVRTAVEATSSPGEVLRVLNRRLLGRGAGLTTCVAVRISAEGEMRLASAGHLAPYRNGREMEVDAALPLGVVEGIGYPEKVERLEAGDRVVLVTDGVVEAAAGRGETREMFGFVRTEGMSGDPAATIAEAAREWGQTDDITVVRLEFVGVAG